MYKLENSYISTLFRTTKIIRIHILMMQSFPLYYILTPQKVTLSETYQKKSGWIISALLFPSCYLCLESTQYNVHTELLLGESAMAFSQASCVQRKGHTRWLDCRTGVFINGLIHWQLPVKSVLWGGGTYIEKGSYQGHDLEGYMFPHSHSSLLSGHDDMSTLLSAGDLPLSPSCLQSANYGLKLMKLWAK